MNSSCIILLLTVLFFICLYVLLFLRLCNLICAVCVTVDKIAQDVEVFLKSDIRLLTCIEKKDDSVINSEVEKRLKFTEFSISIKELDIYMLFNVSIAVKALLYLKKNKCLYIYLY